MRRYIYIALFLILPLLMAAQTEESFSYTMEGKAVVLEVHAGASAAERDSLLRSCRINPRHVEAYQQHDSVSALGWRVIIQKPDGYLKLRKSMKDFASKGKMKEHFVFESDVAAAPDYSQNIRYGFNKFFKPAVVERDDGMTLFYLKITGDIENPDVYLAGSFNNWSTLADPLLKCDSGYYHLVKLKPGPHFYKYILEGHWLNDPRNTQIFTDNEGNENSLYFKENYRFTLPGFEDAREVYVAGSFNDWREGEIRLRKTKTGWSRGVYLREGTHAYKYIVDGKWILDPTHDVVRPDGMGNKNSFMAVGDTFYFHVPGRPDAEQVFVAGNFNEWKEGELLMTRTDSGWTLPYVLAPGNYEYKINVDGRWMTDPGNPIKNGREDFLNSVLVRDANETFELSGYKDAETVLVSGDFNNWSETGYTMRRTREGWRIDLHLPKGKTRYKFKVDGQWLLDPDNPLWEQNEYGTGNSVLWVP